MYDLLSMCLALRKCWAMVGGAVVMAVYQQGKPLSCRAAATAAQGYALGP